MEQQMKQCGHCGQFRSIDAFFRNRATRDGLQNCCKPCSRRLAIENYSRHRVEQCARAAAFSLTAPGRFSQYRRGARRRGVGFLLTRAEFLAYWQQPCTYCHAPIESIGLDRVDNTRGYELGNVVPCCGPCNFAKGARTRDDFLAHVAAIYAVSLGAVFTDQVPATKKAVA